MIEKNIPEVSVIMPVYNAEKYLQECLDALSAQTYKNFEIICINDGSSDKSLEILNKQAADDARFIILDKKNEGAEIARNIGLSKARGKYICFCDADDYYEHNYIEVMLNKIESEDVDIVQCAYNTINDNSIRPDDHIKFTDCIFEINNENFDRFDGVIWDKIFKKSIIDLYNLRFCEIRYFGDEGFVLCYKACCKNAAIISDKLYTYRLNSISLMEKLYISDEAEKYKIVNEHIPLFGYILTFYEKHNFLQKYIKNIIAKACNMVNGKVSFLNSFNKEKILSDFSKLNQILKIKDEINKKFLCFEFSREENLIRAETKLKIGGITVFSKTRFCNITDYRILGIKVFVKKDKLNSTRYFLLSLPIFKIIKNNKLSEIKYYIFGILFLKTKNHEQKSQN